MIFLGRAETLESRNVMLFGRKCEGDSKSLGSKIIDCHPIEVQFPSTLVWQNGRGQVRVVLCSLMLVENAKEIRSFEFFSACLNSD